MINKLYLCEPKNKAVECLTRGDTNILECQKLTTSTIIMSAEIIDRGLVEIQAKVDKVFFNLHQLTSDIGNESLSETVVELRAKLDEPFLFVIAGEVKAGKSSFINALLDTGEEICKVAPDPCTDIIQQIVYGDEQKFENINEYLRKIYLPVEILEKISIVDTPGTNTIIDHHQEITERFIPHSDLIVFVFEAKNPYRQSAWEFFDYISTEWRKKVIFILQQKDLMKPTDLATNIEGVKKQAIEKGIDDPKVFAVSALQELEDLQDISGFIELRKYIVEHITGVNAYKLKMQSNVNTAEQVMNNINNGVGLRKEQFLADVEFRAEVTDSMDEQEKKSFERVDKMVLNLLQDYDRITANVRSEFVEGLSFFTLAGRSVSSLFSSDTKNVKDWLNALTKRLETELQTNFQTKLEDGMTDISESIKTMVKMVDLKMKSSKTILESNHEIFGEIAEKRQHAIKEIQKNYIAFVSNTENFIDDEIFPSARKYVPDVAAGGGLAVVGTIMALSSQTLAVDITGGIIAGIGFIFAGATLFFRKRKAINSFDEEITKGRKNLERVLEDQIKTYTTKIKERLDENFDPFDIHIKQEEKSLNSLEEKISIIDVDIRGLKKELAEDTI